MPFKDVQDEIFDMIKPQNPYKITLVDLIRSGHGETVTNILIDLNSFWTHENRESLVAEPSSSTPTSPSSGGSPPKVTSSSDEEGKKAKNENFDGDNENDKVTESD